MSSNLVQAKSTAFFRSPCALVVSVVLDAFCLLAKVMHCQKAFSKAHQRTSQVRSSKFLSIMSILIMAVDCEIDWEEVSLARYSWSKKTLVIVIRLLEKNSTFSIRSLICFCFCGSSLTSRALHFPWLQMGKISCRWLTIIS